MGNSIKLKMNFKYTHLPVAGFLALVLVAGMTSPAFATLVLTSDGSFTGNGAGGVGVSSDACGNNSPPCSIEQDVPAGATVLKAYLYATTNFVRPASVDIELDGDTKTLAELPNNDAGFPGFLGSYRADVTADVAAALGGNAAHVFSVDDSVELNTVSVNGVGLVIVYRTNTIPAESSVLIFDGGLGASPPTQTLIFGAPVDTANPAFSAEMRLGIGHGFQGGAGSQCGGDEAMDSQIDINSIRLTSCAGNFDDGLGFNGALITIGGVGDDLNNPADPFQRAGDGANSLAIEDDERYDIESFIGNGTTQLDLDTINVSNDDLVFLSILAFEGVTVDIPDRMIGGTVGSLDTATLLVAGAQANMGWWSIVMIGAVAIGAGIVYKVKSNKTNKETL